MVDTIRFRCPTCERPLRATRQAAGRLIDCPKCAARIRVPDPADRLHDEPPRSAADGAAKACYFCSVREADHAMEIDLARPAAGPPARSRADDIFVEVPRCRGCRFVHRGLWWWVVVPTTLVAFVAIFAAVHVLDASVPAVHSSLMQLGDRWSRRMGQVAVPIIFLGSFLAASAVAGIVAGTLVQRSVQARRRIKPQAEAFTYPEVTGFRATGWVQPGWSLDFTLSSAGGFGMALVFVSLPAVAFGGLIPATLLVAGTLGLFLSIGGLIPRRGRGLALVGLALFALRTAPVTGVGPR